MIHPETLHQVLGRLEPDTVFDGCMHDNDYTPERRATMSIAISLKRIADALGQDSPFLNSMSAVLDDVSHNHQQRMRNL